MFQRKLMTCLLYVSKQIRVAGYYIEIVSFSTGSVHVGRLCKMGLANLKSLRHCAYVVVVVVVVVYLFQQANKTCNNNIISPTKPGNQKGKCPSCWPPTAQTK